MANTLMTLDAAIRTLRFDFEAGLNRSNRSAREQYEHDIAREVVNRAINDGTYDAARSRVDIEDGVIANG